MSHPGLGHVDLDRHKLSQAEAERRFRERIVPQLLAPLGLKAQAQPTVVMLGGPPGVGKTSLAEVIARRLGNAGTLDVDSMRDFHPQYRELLQADELTAARYTNRDASRWLQMALAYAGERRWNLVKEGTLRVPERVEAGAQLLRDRGWHRVEAAYVAAAPACSQLSMVLRYLRQHDTLGAGRFVNVESHDWSPPATSPPPRTSTRGGMSTPCTSTAATASSSTPTSSTAPASGPGRPAPATPSRPNATGH